MSQDLAHGGFLFQKNTCKLKGINSTKWTGASARCQQCLRVMNKKQIRKPSNGREQIAFCVTKRFVVCEKGKQGIPNNVRPGMQRFGMKRKSGKSSEVCKREE